MNELEKHLISKEESALLVKEYDKSNYEAINAKRPGKKPDSKSYTYDLEVLQDYINLIRDGMEKMGIKKKGIKINLGKYSENGFDPRLDPVYKGYQTIFFSPENLDSETIAERLSDDSDLEKLPNLDYGQLCPPY